MSRTATRRQRPAWPSFFPVVLAVLAAHAPLAQPAVVDVALYDADADQEIRNLTPTDAIDLAQMPSRNLTLVANTAGGAESVRFAFDGQSNFRTENIPPYSLGGDRNGDYAPVAQLSQPGDYVITATPYTADNAGGTAGEPLTLRLSVTDSAAEPPAACVPPEDGDYIVSYDPGPVPTGRPAAWRAVTFTLVGPCASEDGTPNPFLDYRYDLDVQSFDDGSVGFTVPGYYAADGDAAETSATSGNTWRAHVVLPEGSWKVVSRFYEGPAVAVADDPRPQETYSVSDAFEVGPPDASVCDNVVDCQDNRLRGPLRYVGERHLRFDNGEYFLKGGADSPENLLAYADFDDTYDTNGTAKTWGPHVQDWSPGDPTWQGGKGKGLIGALNYLKSKGMNAFSFLPFNNPQGDGKDVWPWTTPGATPEARLRYDVSKLAQWDVVFQHADSLGMFLHVKTQETENDQVLDGGALGTGRKLYYRELVARFGYHLALNWNLGEENTNTDAQRRAFAEYLAELDPYDHPIVVHTFPGQYEDVYAPLLGDSELTGASVQLGNMSGGHAITLEWLRRSAEAGRPWHVAIDEPGSAGQGVTCDGPGNNYRAAREEALWANLMAGGTGVEWYFGYQTCAGDLSAEDWRTRDQLWDQTRYALRLFRNALPFWEMESADGLLAGADGYVLAKAGEVYAAYLPVGEAASASLTLPSGPFDVRWYNVRTGGRLQTGTVDRVSGGGARALGAPPADTGQDWAVVVTAADAPAGEVVFALNAGGGAVTTGGVAYGADAGASGGRTYQTNDPIAGTDDDALYQTERYGTFGYDVPLGAGTYQVTLRFAEVYWTAAGKRSFDVVAEGTTVVQGLDLFAEAGHDAAYDLTTTVEVTDGTLDLDFVTVANNAKLSAVVVRSTGATAARTASAEASTADAAARVFPNPTGAAATVAFGLAEAVDVRLEVFDALGRRVAVLLDGPAEAGSHRARFDAGALPAGVYVWRLAAGARVETGQIVVAR